MIDQAGAYLVAFLVAFTISWPLIYVGVLIVRLVEHAVSLIRWKRAVRHH